jgi:hypothetical protein
MSSCKTTCSAGFDVVIAYVKIDKRRIKCDLTVWVKDP